MTAREMQVRKPIKSEGLKVAAYYRQHLQTFVDAYFAAGEEPGT